MQEVRNQVIPLIRNSLIDQSLGSDEWLTREFSYQQTLWKRYEASRNGSEFNTSISSLPNLADLRNPCQRKGGFSSIQLAINTFLIASHHDLFSANGSDVSAFQDVSKQTWDQIKPNEPVTFIFDFKNLMSLGSFGFLNVLSLYADKDNTTVMVTELNETLRDHLVFPRLLDLSNPQVLNLEIDNESYAVKCFPYPKLERRTISKTKPKE